MRQYKIWWNYSNKGVTNNHKLIIKVYIHKKLLLSSHIKPKAKNILIWSCRTRRNCIRYKISHMLIQIQSNLYLKLINKDSKSIFFSLIYFYAIVFLKKILTQMIFRI